jgi:hypothetical protein
MSTSVWSNPDGTARVFLSWAHDDERVKESLLRFLTPCLKIMKGVRFEWWQDSHINCGDEWRRNILARLYECDFGLLLLSPAFFASEFITSEELSTFVGEHATKGALPVGLVRLPDADKAELYETDKLQMFRLDGRYFHELTRESDKARFARELAEQIRRRLMGVSPWRPL